MTPNRDFDKAFASIFGLPNGLMPTVPTPDPLSADEAEHETENGLFVGPEWAANLPTLSPDEIAEGNARQEHC